MDKLAAIPADQLRRELAAVGGAKAALRLVVALDYKNGEAVDDLSSRYGIPASTLYAWLDRFENRSLDDAIEDGTRPGRPARLTPTERNELRGLVRAAEPDIGTEWTPESLRRHIEDRYDVRYSIGHARRLLREFSSE